MLVPKSYGNTSIPRLRYFWLCFSIVAGYGIVHLLGIDDRPSNVNDLRTFAGIMVTAAASMSALAIAGSGVLYALLNISLIKALHDSGALNRVIFDLLICAALWLIALGSALVAGMPFFVHTKMAMHISCVCAAAGLMYFGPIGYAFWILLANAKTPVNQVSTHNWTSPTVLDQSSVNE